MACGSLWICGHRICTAKTVIRSIGNVLATVLERFHFDPRSIPPCLQPSSSCGCVLQRSSTLQNKPCSLLTVYPASRLENTEHDKLRRALFSPSLFLELPKQFQILSIFCLLYCTRLLNYLGLFAFRRRFPCLQSKRITRGGGFRSISPRLEKVFRIKIYSKPSKKLPNILCRK